MKIIKYIKETAILTDKTFEDVMNAFEQGAERVYVSEIGTYLYNKGITHAGNPLLSDEELKKTYLDGREVINKFGKWYFADDPEKQLDTFYYDIRNIKTKAETIEETQLLALEDKTKRLNA